MKIQGVKIQGVRIQRVLSMSGAEILYRSRQRWSIALERLMAGPARSSGATSDTGAAERLEQFRALAPSRFFAGASDAAVPGLLLTHNPDDRQQCLMCADAIRRGKFRILGYGMLNFRPTAHKPLDWHFDPISGIHSPRIHWSRIDALDTSQVGDSKVIWEMGRHQWLLDLGQAYQDTGDECYARKAFELLESWMADNPVGIGIHWNSSLEIAYRLIAWCWALVLFLGSSTLTPTVFATLETWIRRQALHVERHLSHYYSPNTHLTGEALGLFHVGVLFPEMREAARWRSVGQRILEQQLRRQVLPDGVHFEQSTHYQAYTVEIYLQFLILADRNNMPVPAWVPDRVQAMVDFLSDTRQPNGVVAAIGDADGGSLLPLVHRAPGDYRGLFSVAAALFRRDDYAWFAGAPTPEALRLLGCMTQYPFLALGQHAPTNRQLAVYPDGGYAMLRSHWRDSAHHMIFDVGPLGCPDSGAHGHADLLSIQCSVFGEPCLVDAGTGCYTRDPTWRNHFRSSQAHNTATVDNRSQIEPCGPFSWLGHRPAARLIQHRADNDTVLLEGVHPAYLDLSDPVEHRRRVLFIRNEYWIVVDDFDGADSHEVVVRYQFADIPVSMGSDQWVRAHCHNGTTLLVRTLSSESLSRNLVCGSQNPMQGWLSADYGQCVPAPVFTSTANCALPLRIVTVLYPQRESDAPAPTITLTVASDVNEVLVDGEHTDRITINHADITFQGEVVSCAA